MKKYVLMILFFISSTNLNSMNEIRNQESQNQSKITGKLFVVCSEHPLTFGVYPDSPFTINSYQSPYSSINLDFDEQYNDDDNEIAGNRMYSTLKICVTDAVGNICVSLSSTFGKKVIIFEILKQPDDFKENDHIDNQYERNQFFEKMKKFYPNKKIYMNPKNETMYIMK